MCIYVYIKSLHLTSPDSSDDEKLRYKNISRRPRLIRLPSFAPVNHIAFSPNHRNHVNRAIFNIETIKLSNAAPIPGLVCSLIEIYFWTLLPILSWTIVSSDTKSLPQIVYPIFALYRFN